jgi:hypothetical protein
MSGFKLLYKIQYNRFDYIVIGSIMEYLNNILQSVFDVFPDNWSVKCYLKTLNLIKNLATLDDIACGIMDEIFDRIDEGSLSDLEYQQLYEHIISAMNDLVNVCDTCLKTDCKNPDECGESLMDSGIQSCGGCIDVCRCKIY